MLTKVNTVCVKLNYKVYKKYLKWELGYLASGASALFYMFLKLLQL